MIYIWVVITALFTCVKYSKGVRRTEEKPRDFGFCSNALIGIPDISLSTTEKPLEACITYNTITMYFKPPPDDKVPCGEKIDRMCIASYYVPEYKIPLFTAVHLPGYLLGQGDSSGQGKKDWEYRAVTKSSKGKI